MTELRNAITLKARPGITDPGPRFHFIQDLAALVGAGLPTRRATLFGEGLLTPPECCPRWARVS
jgi:hypothetical protein